MNWKLLTSFDSIPCHLRKHEEFLQQSHSMLCDNLGKSPGEEGAQEGVGEQFSRKGIVLQHEFGELLFGNTKGFEDAWSGRCRFTYRRGTVGPKATTDFGMKATEWLRGKTKCRYLHVPEVLPLTSWTCGLAVAFRPTHEQQGYQEHPGKFTDDQSPCMGVNSWPLNIIVS